MGQLTKLIEQVLEQVITAAIKLNDASDLPRWQPNVDESHSSKATR